MFSQINRTLETKVADILAQLPTQNFEHSNKLMQDILDLDINGILQLTDMLVPFKALCRPGGYGRGSPPDPIPNSVVKPPRADGTAS